MPDISSDKGEMMDNNPEGTQGNQRALPPEFLEFFSKAVSPDFAQATNHKYDCRCDKCKAWWILIGPEGGIDTDHLEGGAFGPFSEAELLDYAKANGLEVAWKASNQDVRPNDSGL
jgi:hypothetical protein